MTTKKDIFKQIDLFYKNPDHNKFIKEIFKDFISENYDEEDTAEDIIEGYYTNFSIIPVEDKVTKYSSIIYKNDKFLLVF